MIHDGHVESGRRFVGDQQPPARHAIAITARRMPPEIGGIVDLPGRLRISTRHSITACALATRGLLVEATGLPICHDREHRIQRLMALKIIAIRSRERAASHFRAAGGFGLDSEFPATIRLGTIKRKMESAVTLLPHPDSPTMPSVRPASIEKLTPSTARTIPSSVAKCVERFRTSRSARITCVGTLPVAPGQGGDRVSSLLRGRRPGIRPGVSRRLVHLLATWSGSAC
jgi:hypothetical protein